MMLKQLFHTEKTEYGYLLRGDQADAKLVFLTPDIVRLRVSFEKQFREASLALVTTAWPDDYDKLLCQERRRIQPLDIPLRETEKALIFDTGSLTVTIRKAPFSLTVQDREGTVLHRDLRERAYERDHLGRISHYVCADLQADHFYGFGEKTGKLDKKGRRMRMTPKDAIGHDPEFGEPLYKHIPFYLRLNDHSGKAFGCFYNNSHDTVFDMGNEISGYWERYCYYQADGGDIDLFLINGPSVSQVVERYTWLTGRIPMPPKQSLGYTASTMYYCELNQDCSQEILKVIDKHTREEMYIDNFKLASGYTSGEEDNLRYVFHWNRRRFPEPKAFIDAMKAKGISVIPNLKPGILKRHPNLAQFQQAGGLVKTPDGQDDYIGRWWGGEGRFVDFTSPGGRRVWKELLKQQILELGMTTIWNDNCEYDGIEDRTALCCNEGMGGTMAEFKILQSNMMAYCGKEAFGEVYPNERPYQINRAGFAGIQRYSQVWGGDNLTDWRTPKFNVAEMLGMGLSGLANTGCDIGGFAGSAPEGELLLRWIQNGIFQPRFCINSSNSDNTVTQPWMYREFNDAVREAYAQRYRMIPYLYSAVWEAHQTGKPILRPLFLEFQEDRNCYTDPYDTFLFGRSILVANVFEKGARERTLYLPAGCSWYDLSDNLREYVGGQTIRIPVDTHSIPMFLRGDGIYVTTENLTQISTQKITNLHILVSADKSCCFTCYDDDGHSLDYQRGICRELDIGVQAGERCTITFTPRGTYQDAVETITLRLISKHKGAYWVTVNGKPVPGFMIEEDWAASKDGWFYNLSDRTIQVKLNAIREKTEVVISREKFDLIGMNED